jgi:outer membrane protein TolC
LGLGLTWNFTQTYRLKNQIQSLEVNSAALEWELRTLQRRLKYQEEMADNRLRASREVLDHIPTLLLAAQDSYTRKAALYANGLTDLIDLLQASTALNKAETDRAVAQVNVWSALLLKAASTGDLRLFDHNLE